MENIKRNLKPALTRPPDFSRFWDSTLASLEAESFSIQRHLRPEHAHPNRTLEHLSFPSLGGKWVSAYSIGWHDENQHPLVIHSHGYGSKTEIRWDWSEAGYNVVGVDIRGFGASYEAAPLTSRWGYILTGIESPETSILRSAVCDYIQAVKAAIRLHQGQTSRILLHGASFSGGLALMAEALLQKAGLLVVAVPTFGWAEGRNFFVKAGSGAEIGRYLAARPEHAEDVMLVLRYFDPMNFAGSVVCPSLVGVGLIDEIVPDNTVFAIANHLVGPHEIMEFPYSHSNRPEEALWKGFEARWQELGHADNLAQFGTSGK